MHSKPGAKATQTSQTPSSVGSFTEKRQIEVAGSPHWGSENPSSLQMGDSSSGSERRANSWEVQSVYRNHQASVLGIRLRMPHILCVMLRPGSSACRGHPWPLFLATRPAADFRSNPPGGDNFSEGNYFGKVGVPRGIRTPVAAVKGRCPWPLDDGDACGTKVGEPSAGRTRDPLIKSQMLCQLSYGLNRNGVCYRITTVPVKRETGFSG